MNFAISLAVLDTVDVRNDTRILIGTRRPESNKQHAGVVSVPSQRIPVPLFRTISAYTMGLGLLKCYGHPGIATETYVVQGILAQKLGLADALELGKVRFSTVPRSDFRGDTPIIKKGDVAEEWEMLLLQVHLSEGRGEIPDSTASYSDLRWVIVGQFLTMADDSESGMGGLCVESTAKWLKEFI